MTISAQNPATVTVNSVLVPSIQIDTRIDSTGKLKTGCRIFVQPAAVANAGQANEAWTVAGPAKPIIIPDLANLPADLRPWRRSSPRPRRTCSPWSARSTEFANWSEAAGRS